MNADRIDRARGCLLGLAIGDAIGTTVEFKPRGTFAPMTDMIGGGPFRLQIGEWTDDTSMAFASGPACSPRASIYTTRSRATSVGIATAT